MHRLVSGHLCPATCPLIVWAHISVPCQYRRAGDKKKRGVEDLWRSKAPVAVSYRGVANSPDACFPVCSYCEIHSKVNLKNGKKIRNRHIQGGSGICPTQRIRDQNEMHVGGLPKNSFKGSQYI